MNEKLKKIHEYFVGQGAEEEDLLKSDTSSVYLAMEIAEYAHRNQTRENGEEYVNHPYRVLEGYRRLVGIKPNDYECFDEDLLTLYQIPY